MSMLLINVSKVLFCLKYEHVNTRAGLAARMNLPRASITNIVSYMISQGIIYEKGSEITPHSKGRSRVILEINDGYKLALGVTIDHNRVCLMLSTMNGQTLDNIVCRIVGMRYRDILSLIVEQTAKVMQNNCLTDSSILGMGICVSYDALFHVEGNDKLNRIRKDLSHALPYRIVSRSTVQGTLVAHRTFTHDHLTQGAVMGIRYGNYIMSGYSVNGQIPPFLYGKGGFAALQYDAEGNSYERYMELLKGGHNATVFAAIARDIHRCDVMMNLDRIYTFGNFFENKSNFDTVCQYLMEKYSRTNLLYPAVVTDETIALAGCAAVMDEFYGGGRFWGSPI